MIPLRDVIPSRTFPFITITIIAINALAWFLELSMDPRELNRFLYVYGVVPGDFHPATLVTSMFLHGSWSHVIGNMWYLWIFGDNVEDRCGHGRFAVFYLLCGFAAAAGQILMSAHSLVPTIGASGAIAGMMGAYFVLYPQSRVLTFVPFPLFDVIEVTSDLPAGLLVPDAALQRRRRCHGCPRRRWRGRLRRARRWIHCGAGRDLRVQEARTDAAVGGLNQGAMIRSFGKYVRYRRASRVSSVIPATAAWAPM